MSTLKAMDFLYTTSLQLGRLCLESESEKSVAQDVVYQQKPLLEEQKLSIYLITTNRELMFDQRSQDRNN